MLISRYLIGGLGLSLLICIIGWRLTYSQLEVVKGLREKDKVTYTLEQEKYKTKALEEKAILEKRNYEYAIKADSQYSALLSKYNAGILQRYTQSAQGQVSRDAVPPPTDAPGGSNRPSESSELPAGISLSITLEDAQICAVNTARLQAVQSWAINFIEREDENAER